MSKTRIRTQHWKVTFIGAWLVWLADYLTKQWALAALPGKKIEVLGTLLQLELTFNKGAAFGIGDQSGHTGGVLLGLFAIGASGFVIYFAPFLTSKSWSYVFALLLGGAMGNLSDRIFNQPGLLRGAVTDWLKLPNWPNFNLADSAIVCAAVIAVVLSIKNVVPIEQRTKQP